MFHQAGQAPGFQPAPEGPPPAASVKATRKRGTPKKATPSKAPRKKAPAAKTVREVLPAPMPPRLPALAPEPSVSCAVFNTGELLIELPGQQALRLNRQQSADLLRWLQRVQPTIPMESV